jgi:hypothetical protein
MTDISYSKFYAEALRIAREALDNTDSEDEAREYLHQSCDGHAWAIYYGSAIQLCSILDTSDGEAWLEDCGGIAQPGDTFGNIACRIAFATLLCEAEDKLRKLIYEREDAA